MPRLLYIRCLACSSSLTEQLEQVDYSLRTEEAEVAYLPEGTISQEDGSYFNTHVGEYITNVESSINMSLTKDTSRLVGCCGPSGDWPNLLCDTCNAYVATKVADCGTPRFIVFDPKATFDETIQTVSPTS
jgi:hypothetical protein